MQALPAMLTAVVMLALALPNALAAGAADASMIDASSPSGVVDSVARAVLTEIDTHREDYRKDSAKLDDTIKTLLSPHFDSTHAGGLCSASIGRMPHSSSGKDSWTTRAGRPMT